MNKSSLHVNTGKISDKTMQLFLLLIVATSVIVSLPIATGKSSSNSYSYKFTVNEDGFTWVDITFQSTEGTASSWVFVPKSEFSYWSYTFSGGSLVYSETVETTQVVDEEYYFYEVFKFSFVSESSFQMKIQFNMTEGALIVEPRGMFFSPQIGFDPKSDGKAEVIFPSDFSVQKVDPYGIITKNRVSFDPLYYLVRLQIQFETSGTPKLEQIEQGVFNFKAVKRYESYAYEILDLYNKTYGSLVDLFNITLENIDVQFFIPEFETLLSVGGYVPFTGQTMGEININIFFIRAVNGTIEVIALHELIHHFLWKAGLSPDSFLWFHEGAAQFVSIETVDDLGYEGAAMERNKLEQGATQLISQAGGEKFGFLQDWTPNYQPKDASSCYVASYYVVSKLAEKYGGLDFYKRFFELIQGLKIETNDELALHLSLAANASVDIKLEQWGFNIRLLYTINQSKVSPELIYDAKKAVDGLSPVFLPYNLVAKFLYQQALLRLEHGDYDGATQLLEAAISLANLAPLLTLLTLVAIFAIIAYVLLKRQQEPSFELPPLPPDFEETNA